MNCLAVLLSGMSAPEIYRIKDPNCPDLPLVFEFWGLLDNFKCHKIDIDISYMSVGDADQLYLVGKKYFWTNKFGVEQIKNKVEQLTGEIPKVSSIKVVHVLETLQRMWISFKNKHQTAIKDRMEHEELTKKTIAECMSMSLFSEVWISAFFISIV
jgi:hypothetical protein